MFETSKKAARLEVTKPVKAIQRTDGTRYIKIEDCPKGEFIRAVNGKEVYRCEGYDRYNKKYCATAQSDMNKQRYFKKGTVVEFSFFY